MPRLPQALILRAYKKSPLLPLVLQGARHPELASLELRWLREHVQALHKGAALDQPARQQLLKLCRRRARGEPLQYILGSQPFGPLDIKCQPGVLIPRPETEAYTTHLATLLKEGALHPSLPSPISQQSQVEDHVKISTLKILDVCSGSGCISLLLHLLLSERFRFVRVSGVDISEKAVALANENLKQSVAKGDIKESAQKWMSYQGNIHRRNVPQVQFMAHDILKGLPPGMGMFDVIISNPPYISQRQFDTETTRSVRTWEPKSALVPPPLKNCSGVRLRRASHQDIFYRQLLRFHETYLSKVLLMEVGDDAQAIRVAQMARRWVSVAKFNRIEIWRDWPSQWPDPTEPYEIEIDGQKIPVRGSGKMRSVLLFRTKASQQKLVKRPMERLDELRERQPNRKALRKEKAKQNAKAESLPRGFLSFKDPNP